MNLHDYLAAHHPLVLKEYEMYERRQQTPRRGSIVATLRAGFGGAAEPNRRLKVVDYRDDRIIVEGAWGLRYTISKERWYQEVYIVEEA